MDTVPYSYVDIKFILVVHNVIFLYLYIISFFRLLHYSFKKICYLIWYLI